MRTTSRRFWQQHALSRELIDRFLDRGAHNWARFDAELGYVHGDYVMADGIDGSLTCNRMGADGARFSPSRGDRPCRINSYGNSFTHCDQVSDGETWQEYLAAHLGEPIRNFGTGGHGVYHAYRRMVREESSPNAADHLILNLFEDDHRRNVSAWRWLDLGDDYHAQCRASIAAGYPQAAYFHNNPWDRLVWDRDRRDFTEARSLCASPADLYRFCDPDELRERLDGDVSAQIAMAKKGVGDLDRDLLHAHADDFGVRWDDSSADAAVGSAWDLHSAMGLRATLWTLRRVRDFARRARKRLLLVTSYGPGGIVAALTGKPAADRVLIDDLAAGTEPFLDIRDRHRADYRDFACDPETYARRYFNGHYAPAGNHFFAYALRDLVVDALEPKPASYRDAGTDALARVAAGLNGGAARRGD